MKDNIKLSDLKSKITEKIQGDKKLFIIVCIGILGMLLLLFTELFDSSGGESKNVTSSTKSESGKTLSYSEEMESKLQNIVSSIEGAGKTKVMITLENSAESVYAADENSDKSSSKTSQGDKTEEKSDYKSDSEYIIIDSGDKESGLVIKVIQPKIRGVAVVCEGADSAVVRQNIMATVTAVLDIKSTNVCITKMTNDN